MYSHENLEIGTRIKIKNWLDDMEINYYLINTDLIIDIIGSVYLYNKDLTEFPDFINFNKVTGKFDCSDNNLSTLRGVPRYVGEDFDCSNNQLTTLENSPQYVGGDFECSNNKITSLRGAPKRVRNRFFCFSNLVGFTKEEIKAVCKTNIRKYNKRREEYI